MTRKTYMRKRRFLLCKVLEYNKANNCSTADSRKRAYKTLDRQQTPNFNVYGSYQEAYDDLYNALKVFVQEAQV